VALIGPPQENETRDLATLITAVKFAMFVTHEIHLLPIQTEQKQTSERTTMTPKAEIKTSPTSPLPRPPLLPPALHHPLLHPHPPPVAKESAPKIALMRKPKVIGSFSFLPPFTFLMNFVPGPLLVVETTANRQQNGDEVCLLSFFFMRS
jgi:hypothetical protein